MLNDSIYPPNQSVLYADQGLYLEGWCRPENSFIKKSPEGLQHKKRCLGELLAEEWMMAEESACLKLKEKMRRKVNGDETSHTEII